MLRFWEWKLPHLATGFLRVMHPPEEESGVSFVLEPSSRDNPPAPPKDILPLPVKPPSVPTGHEPISDGRSPFNRYLMVSYNTSKENLEACKQVSVKFVFLVQVTLAFIYCVVVVFRGDSVY